MGEKQTDRSARARDTGLALVLLVLLAVQIWSKYALVSVAIILLLLVMVCPVVFRPAAVVWFGLSDRLGRVGSTVLLTVVYFGVVMPVGIVRRMMGRDEMRRGEFKGATASALRISEHRYTSEDVEKPY